MDIFEAEPVTAQWGEDLFSGGDGKGEPNGFAGLDGTGRVPISQAPVVFVPFVNWDGNGSTPPRPVTVAGQMVVWVSPVQPTGGGTVGGGAGAVDDLDVWIRMP